MTEHASLRVACGSTGVDKAHAFSWFLFLHLFKNDLLLDIFAQCEKILPGIESFVLEISGELIESVDNNCLDVGQSVQVHLIFLQLLYTVDDNEFGFGMVCLIEASL
jgi:hypothetical protein